MCGIFGLHTSQAGLDDSRVYERLHFAQKSLSNRGPDDSGVEEYLIPNYHNGDPSHLFLGHTRLSIIDISDAGHQPMKSIDGRYTMVFNGEIYNYRELREELRSLSLEFCTESDTEVLLAAWSMWGLSCIRRLIGMFAIAVYDHHENSVTLIRDAFGIKPLFYSHSDSLFAFASELPALLALDGRFPMFNWQQVYDYLAYGLYDNSATTFIEGVSHLLPAHWCRIDLKTMRIQGPHRWWWPSIQERSDLSFEEASNHVREIFLKNVRLHLRSDVPLGAALSGGVDSSAVVCAMRRVDPDLPIHTFSFIAPGTLVNEEKWVDIINSHVGAIPHKEVVDPQDFGQDLEDLIASQGEPFGSTSIYAQYCVFRSARKAGIVVTLDGQGADELFAGYNGYPSEYVRSLFDHHSYLKAIIFLFRWARWPGRGYLRAFLILMYSLTPNVLSNYAYLLAGKNPRPGWLNLPFLLSKSVCFSPPPARHYTADSKGRRLVSRLRDSLLGNGLSSLLRHGDRNSMRWSVESRVPFLTIEMAEFVLSLPESFLLGPNGETKRIFRAAMRGIVPDEILDRRDKIGFATPERSWLTSQSLIVNTALKVALELPVFVSSKLFYEINRFLAKPNKNTQLVWRMINFIYCASHSSLRPPCQSK
jgi:asparagine synthase (glutamine-hydrolysing)